VALGATESDGAAYYDWDGRDMLVGVRSTEQGWIDNEIRYNGLASRVSLVDSTGMTYFTWDGIRVLKTEDGALELKQRQVHGYSPIASVGDIALVESGRGEYVPVPDQVGTIWRAVDSSASVANSYAFDAFGVSRSASEAFSNPFRFAGKPLDADPTLYHFIARQYDPALGRFLSREPMWQSSRLSFYDYVQSNSPSAVDPWGRSIISCFRAFRRWSKASKAQEEACNKAADARFKMEACINKNIANGRCCPRDSTNRSRREACCKPGICKSECDRWQEAQRECNARTKEATSAWLKVIWACMPWNWLKPWEGVR